MTVLKLSVAALACSVLFGCQTVKQPTIAHTHIGHALTAWPTTPNERGLFIVAEEEARALGTAANSVSAASSLQEIQAAARKALQIVKPSKEGPNASENFGLRRAFDEAISHLEFAATANDSSANFRASIPKLTSSARHVNERIELVGLLAQDVLNARNTADASSFIQEIRTVSNEIRLGAEIDGKAPIGSSPEEIGLKQLRNQIAAITAREKPQYVPVEEKWLFGLIRLPSGRWEFKSIDEWGSGDGGDGGDGGGGGGGGY